MNVFEGKNILVTSGGTCEYIDDVRVVTNISTGALGAKIAEELFRRGAKVHYVHGQFAKMPGISEDTFTKASLTCYRIKTCNDLYETMKGLLVGLKIDSVVHAAAVSDFTFKNDGAVKLSSDDAEGFIEYLSKTITRTPKIIKEIKVWSPATTLIGFKFTVGSSFSELMSIAQKSGVSSGCDAVFANDKSMMQEAKEHIGYLLNISNKVPADSPLELSGKKEIAKGISDYLEKVFSE
jgi:phosphopantothenate--cysteine ligase